MVKFIALKSRYIFTVITALFCIDLALPPLAPLAFAFTPETNFPITDLQATNIQNNEKLILTISSQGCFHNNYDMYILSASDVEYQGEHYPLSWKDREEIDKIVTAWAAIPPDDEGYCTTTTSLNLVRKRNDEVIAQARFFDGNCRAPGFYKIFGNFLVREDNQTLWTEEPK